LAYALINSTGDAMSFGAGRYRVARDLRACDLPGIAVWANLELPTPTWRICAPVSAIEHSPDAGLVRSGFLLCPIYGFLVRGNT
jgi:hypothetical protein